MDSAAFDRLTRSISVRARRRSLLAALAALGLATFAALDASAKKCKGNKKKCGKKCIPKKNCCANADCAKKISGQQCKKGTCKCPRGRKVCGKRCIDDDLCCTRNAKGCPYTEVCQAGTCVDCLGEECAGNEDCCTNFCFFDVSTFTSECACLAGNTQCESDPQCCNGRCDPDSLRCACDPNGSPCNAGESCCSGNCVDNKCAR